MTDEKQDELFETVTRIDTKLDILVEPTGRIARIEQDLVDAKVAIKSLERSRWILHGVVSVANMVIFFVINLILGWLGLGKH